MTQHSVLVFSASKKFHIWECLGLSPLIYTVRHRSDFPISYDRSDVWRQTLASDGNGQRPYEARGANMSMIRDNGGESDMPNVPETS